MRDAVLNDLLRGRKEKSTLFEATKTESHPANYFMRRELLKSGAEANKVIRDKVTETAKKAIEEKKEKEKKKKQGAQPKGKLHVDLANKVAYSR